MTVIFHGLRTRSATNTKGIRTYTDVYLLETTSQDDGAYAVGSDPNLPQVGSAHYDDPGAWCVSISVENNNFWKGWTVTANYDSSSELSPNPIFEPAQISWDFEQYQKVADVDKNGDGITNSAGDLFTEPPPMRDDSRPIVTISKNLAAVPTYILTYQDAVNSTAFTVDGISIAAGKAKCNRISISPQQERNGYGFRTVTFELHLQRDGWALHIMDAGFREKDGTTRKNIKNEDGTLPPKPPLLNGTGNVLANPSATGAVFLDFDVYYAADFNLLPLS